jgi:hypothetical protein
MERQPMSAPVVFYTILDHAKFIHFLQGIKECGFVIHNPSLSPIMMEPTSDIEEGPLFTFVIKIENVLTKITYVSSDDADAKELEEELSKLGLNCYDGDVEIE